MKKYTSFKIIIWAILLSAGISSCTKSGTTKRDLMLGKWKLQTVAIDSNSDNIIETNEIRDTSLYPNYFANFNTNGSGFYNYNSANPYPFSWALSNHDSILMITDSLYISTESWFIDSVSTSTLNIYFRDTASRKVWNIYKRP